MATIIQIKTDNNSQIRAQTADNSITPTIVANRFDDLADEIQVRGYLQVATTGDLATQSGANSKFVLVNGIGIFSYSPSGIANGTTIFNASGGGVWNLVLAPGAGIANKQTGTLLADGTIDLFEGRYYSRILLRPAAILSDCKIGFTLAGEEVMPAQELSAGIYFNAAIDKYAAGAGLLYLAGITSSTEYILFYE